jgi:glycosyltransferase involved in cell wall biosynthesis
VPELRRLLMTADTAGGVFQYALELAGGLADAGVEVLVATMGHAASAEQSAALRRLNARIEVVHGDFALEWMDDPWSEVDAAGGWLLDLASRFDPDVMHVNGYVHAAIPFGRPTVAVAHSCLLSWWQAVRGTDVPPTFDEYRRRVSRGIASADVVVSPSSSMQAMLFRSYPLPKKAAVIYNGRDPGRFRPADKEPFVLGMGRIWDEGKNLRLLDDVAREIAWPVVVAGPTTLGANRCTLEAARHVGSLDEDAVRRLVGRASIYALPARYEPFGLSILEAALAGAALVVGDIPSLREIWDDAAVYVSPDDRAGAIESIRRLIEDASYRDEMSRRAHAHALRYSSAIMVSRYLHLYDQLLRGGRKVAQPWGAACA